MSRAPRKPQPGARLTWLRRFGVNTVGLLVWASGVGWLVFHYFLQQKGEFGPEPHPLEPWWLKLHGATGFAALWTVGLLWAVHIVNGWTSGRRRWTGSVMFVLLCVLILTGYLLYYVGDVPARPVISLTHWIGGLVLPASYLLHRLLERRPPGQA